MQRKMKDKCGARRRDGGRCTQPAGAGTQHLGFGTCKFHGGNMQVHMKKEIKRQAVIMGAPKEINPLDAIIWCIQITAGEIEWMNGQIAKLQEEQWIEFTIQGKQLNVWQRARSDAQDRLVRYSKDAITLGLAERAIRLAEQFGVTIAKLLEGIAADLDLTVPQQRIWPSIVRKHLIMLEQAQTIQARDRDNLKELAAGNGSR